MIKSKFTSKICKVLHNLTLAGFPILANNVPHLDLKMVSSAHTVLCRMPFLEIVNSPAPNSPGLLPFLFPTPLSHAAPLRVDAHSMIPCECFYYRTHHFLVMCFIFSIKLGCLRKRVHLTCSLYRQCQVQDLAPRRSSLSI